MIILALGSNLTSNFGNRFVNIDKAVEYLKDYNIKIIKKSSFYETESFPNKNNPKFINIVIEVSTQLDLEDLASKIMIVENKLGRKRGVKNQPRTCDIDIIDYNNKEIKFTKNQFEFIVPHISLESRNFVLFPLKEILPNWKHPKSKESINTLIEKLPLHERNSILKVNKN